MEMMAVGSAVVGQDQVLEEAVELEAEASDVGRRSRCSCGS